MCYKKNAHDEIWTRAGVLPADLESAALDRSATCASITSTPEQLTYQLISQNISLNFIIFKC